MILPGFPMSLIGGAKKSIEFVGFEVSSESASPIIIDTPSNVIAGDTLIAVLGRAGSPQTWTFPSGWTMPIGSENVIPSLGVGYTQLAAPPSSSYSFTPSLSTNFGGLLLAFRNIEDVLVGTAFFNDSISTAISSISMGAGLLLAVAASRDNAPSDISGVPSGMDQIYLNTVPGGPRIGIASQEFAGGSTGTRAFSGNSSRSGGVLIGLT